MKSNRFGCVTASGVIAALVAVLLVAAIFLLNGGSLFSPGALSAKNGYSRGGVTSHAELNGNCAACHTAPWEKTTMADRCLACHWEVATELQTPGALHNVLLAKDSAATCRTCHTDHKGANASITSMPSGDFPHDTLGFSLKAHPKLSNGNPFTCQDCHPQGPATFDVKTCTTCHASIDATFMTRHTTAYGSACLSCHDGKESYGKAFNHNQVAFTLTGKHASLDCGACHTGSRTIADLKATQTNCFACHQKDDTHKGAFGQNCAACHNTTDWKQATFDHATTAFPLTGAHSLVDCTKCHVNNVFKGTPTDCFACHQKDDHHQGAFGQDCAACHTTAAWLPASFDHSKSAFPLTGAHTTVDCVKCHVNNVFKGTPTDCFACHQKDDHHQGAFGQDCAACHTTSAWLPASFDHSKSAFPLTGAHLNVDCTKCHVNNVFKGTPTACSACHTDPPIHKDLFGLDCASCHNTTAWLPATFNLAHTFPLNHGGANANCQTCHPTSLASYTCYTCHANIKNDRRHAGFANLDNCIACHPNGRGGD